MNSGTSWSLMGRVKPEELETEKAARAADTAEILALAHTLTIKVLNGKRREYIDLFECWERSEDKHYPYGDPEPGLIRLPYEGYRQTVFLNPEALDYVSFPTRKVEGDGIESYDDGLTDDGEIEADGDDAKVIKLVLPRLQPTIEAIEKSVFPIGRVGWSAEAIFGGPTCGYSSSQTTGKD